MNHRIKAMERRKAIRLISRILSCLLLLVTCAAVIAWLLSFWFHMQTLYVLPWKRAASSQHYVRADVAKGRLRMEYVVYSSRFPIPNTLYYKLTYLDARERALVDRTDESVYRYAPRFGIGPVYGYRWLQGASGATWETHGLFLARWACAAVLLSGWSLSIALIVSPRYRRGTGYCHACGYDLRGSRHSDTCPECGQPIARSKQRAASVARTQPAEGNSPPG
ncbi:MAG: hypothetical protein WD009_12730 [Phycisphaeraceae bacterium]